MATTLILNKILVEETDYCVWTANLVKPRVVLSSVTLFLAFVLQVELFDCFWSPNTVETRISMYDQVVFILPLWFPWLELCNNSYEVWRLMKSGTNHAHFQYVTD